MRASTTVTLLCLVASVTPSVAVPSIKSERGINNVDTDGTLVASAGHGGETAPTSGKTTPPDSDTASSKSTSFFTAQGLNDDAASVHTDPPDSDTASSKSTSFFTAQEPNDDAASVHTEPPGREPPNDPGQDKPNDPEQKKSGVAAGLAKTVISAITEASIASIILVAADEGDSGVPVKREQLEHFVKRIDQELAARAFKRKLLSMILDNLD